MADIFISYTDDDRSWAAALASALEAEGFSTWWDRNLLPGAKYRDVIDRELESARAVVVVWSARSIGSVWVRDEAEDAKRGDKLIPVFKERVKQPLGFRQFQTADLSQWPDQAGPQFDQLVSGIKLLIAGPRGSREPSPQELEGDHDLTIKSEGASAGAGEEAKVHLSGTGGFGQDFYAALSSASKDDPNELSPEPAPAISMRAVWIAAILLPLALACLPILLSVMFNRDTQPQTSEIQSDVAFDAIPDEPVSRAQSELDKLFSTSTPVQFSPSDGIPGDEGGTFVMANWKTAACTSSFSIPGHQIKFSWKDVETTTYYTDTGPHHTYSRALRFVIDGKPQTDLTLLFNFASDNEGERAGRLMNTLNQECQEAP